MLLIYYSQYCIEKNKGHIYIAKIILDFYNADINYIIKTDKSFLSVRNIPQINPLF